MSTQRASTRVVEQPTALALVSIESELRRFMARARMRSAQMAAAVHPQLDPALYALLMEIVASAPIRSVDLAARRGVTKSVISRQIAALTELGLIDREADPQDARASVITLTSAGRKAAKTMDAARRDYLQRLLDGVEPDQLVQIAASLGILNDALE